MFSQKCVVFSSLEYRIVDEGTGAINEGVSVRLLFSDDMTPCADRTQKGYKPMKAAMSLDKAHKIKDVPAIYDCKFDMSVDSLGKAALKLVDLEYLKSFVLLAE